MKVAHVLHLYPPEFRGGTEACVETLAASQRARGDAVFVVAGSDERDESGRVDLDAVDHVPVFRVRRHADENYSVDARHERVATKVLELIDSERPDIVHLHHTMTLSADLGARLAAAGHVVVATLHDFTTICARHFLVRPDGDSCAPHLPVPRARCADCLLPDFPAGAEQLAHELEAKQQTAAAELAAYTRVVVPSEIVAERWRASGAIRDERLRVVSHPAPGLGRAVPTPRLRADGRLVLATWGHLAPAKGVLDLLAALRLAADPRLALVILGAPVDADHAGELLDAAEGLDVSFGGAYEPEDLRALAERADLAVFPSRAEETFGLVVAEARGLGLPVLVSDRGALPEGVGQAGAALAAADPAAWATRLVELANDPGTLERWRSAARRDLLGPLEHAGVLAELYAEALRA